MQVELPTLQKPLSIVKFDADKRDLSEDPDVHKYAQIPLEKFSSSRSENKQEYSSIFDQHVAFATPKEAERASIRMRAASLN